MKNFLIWPICFSIFLVGCRRSNDNADNVLLETLTTLEKAVTIIKDQPEHVSAKEIEAALSGITRDLENLTKRWERLPTPVFEEWNLFYLMSRRFFDVARDIRQQHLRFWNEDTRRSVREGVNCWIFYNKTVVQYGNFLFSMKGINVYDVAAVVRNSDIASWYEEDICHVRLLDIGVIYKLTQSIDFPPPAYSEKSDRETEQPGSRHCDTPEGCKVITNSIGMKLVYIPPGTFMMGSPSSEKGRDDNESPQRQVRISKGFWMGQTEVTVGQYLKYMNSDDSTYIFVDLSGEYCPIKKSGYSYTLSGNKFASDIEQPMAGVNWDGAFFFCKWLSRKERKTYRLPTEAEWEYACRAGITTPFYFGDSISTDQANYDGNRTYGSEEKGLYRQTTIKVRSFAPNAFGLYDMVGNVFEWCSDWYDEDYYSYGSEADPKKYRNQYDYEYTDRVVRGGCYGSDPEHCRSASRSKLRQRWCAPSTGFRVVLELE